MEILSNFYYLLTIKNDTLTSIFISPTIFIEAWIIFKLFTSILNFNYTKRQEFNYIFIMSISSILMQLFIPSPFNIFVNYFIMFIVVTLIFHTSIIKGILSIIIPTVIMALVNLIINKPLLLLLNLTYEQMSSTPIFRLFYLAIIYIILGIIIQFIKFKNLNFIISAELDLKNKIIILINLFLGLFTLAIQAILTEFYTDTLPLFITLLNFISLLTYFFTSFFSLTRILKLQIATQELESAENYNNTLSYLYDNVKAFKHDFDNMVFTIGGFINTNDIDGLKKYYKDLEKDCQRVNGIALLNPTIVNNSGIYNLLMAKYKKASQLNVEINLEIFFDFKQLHMPIYEFARILGILLDNSIEAASETKSKRVNIVIRDSINNKTQLLCIKNTYKDKRVDKNKIFEKGITGKESHSGMGLWEVKQILLRNSNVKLLTENDDTYFTQQLEIHY